MKEKYLFKRCTVKCVYLKFKLDSLREQIDRGCNFYTV